MAASPSAIASGSLKNQKLPPQVGAFLGSLSVKRIPNTRLMEVTFESTNPQLAARDPECPPRKLYRSKITRAVTRPQRMRPSGCKTELNELSVKVRHSEDARIEYERNNQIWTRRRQEQCHHATTLAI